MFSVPLLTYTPPPSVALLPLISPPFNSSFAPLAMYTAPPFVAPCYYGTDIDSAENLIANHHSVEEIARIIGVDTLGYLPTEYALRLTGCDTGFCTACFGGKYPTPIPTVGRKDRFENKIHS